ncbi:MAG: glycosyltransferase family 39 protein [bacterium]
MSNIIEEPSMWRQCDTFFYSYEFYKSGINLLSPSVCWMGDYKTVALEFPVVSAVIAFFFNVFGAHISISKLVCLLFYAGSVWYLFLLFKLLFYKQLAYIISLIYAALPLGLYYSRAVIIDFAELLFVFAAFYYFIVWMDKVNIKNLMLTLIFLTLALLTKAPYILLIVFPSVYEIYRRQKSKLVLRNLIFFFIPFIIFITWQNYVYNLNSKAPDWYFIPGYFKFTNMSSWYFGNINSRFDLSTWKTLFFRFGESITSYIGVLLFAAGIFIKLKNNHSKKIFALFSFSSVIYLLVFFDLNRIHDYYQIPFLCIASFYIAVTFDYLIDKFQNKKIKFLTIIISVFFLINCIWFTERWYFKVNRLKKTSSEIIRNKTPENSLVIVSDMETDPRDPTVLAPALRTGWSVNYKNLSQEIIDKLKSEGANYLLLVLKDDVKDNYNNNRLIDEKSFENKWNIRLYLLEK